MPGYSRFTAKKDGPVRMSVAAAFHEVKHNPPKILEKTRKKKGKKRARKQAIAIALSKAGVGKG